MKKGFTFLFRLMTIISLSVATMSCGNELHLLLPETERDENEGTIDNTQIVYGKVNVITRYYQSDYEEYVNANDGSVKYTVFNDVGRIAPGAIVHSIIYVDANGDDVIIDVEKTVDADGHIWLEKELLPTAEGIEKYLGCIADVSYTNSKGNFVQEYSADNCIVPTKVEIKLEYRNVTLNTHSQQCYFNALRSLDGGLTWGIIPDYLTYNDVTIGMYAVADYDTVTEVPAYAGETLLATATTNNLYGWSTGSLTSGYLNFNRLIVPNDYTKFTNAEWDGNEHYYAAYMETLYGETAYTDEIVQRSPWLQAPRIFYDANNSNVTEGSSANLTFLVGATFKMVEADIDTNMLFNAFAAETTPVYNVTRWLPYLNIDLDAVVTRLTFTSPQTSDGSNTTSYSNYANIYNVNTTTNAATGFTSEFLYDGGRMYFGSSTYFYGYFYYSPVRTVDANNGQITWTLTSPGIKDDQVGYKTIVITL